MVKTEKKIKCNVCRNKFPLSENIFISNEYNTILECPFCNEKITLKRKIHDRQIKNIKKTF